MIQGYRLAGKGFPPKAQGHVSQPVQLKSKAKNSDWWNGVRVVSATLPPTSAMGLGRSLIPGVGSSSPWHPCRVQGSLRS